MEGGGCGGRWSGWKVDVVGGSCGGRWLEVFGALIDDTRMFELADTKAYQLFGRGGRRGRWWRRCIARSGVLKTKGLQMGVVR